MTGDAIRIEQGRIRLALHPLRVARDGPQLLLLHELRGQAADWDEEAIAAWPGPVHALDFSGHGASACVPGGGYVPELYATESDHALARLEAAGDGVALAGAGLGAYVALLVAGARAEAVRACLLLPGRGLAGGGALPDFDAEPGEPPVDAHAGPPPDPLVSACDEDVRPPDYAADFARATRRLLLSETVDTPPPWWTAARGAAPRVETAPADLGEALRTLARG